MKAKRETLFLNLVLLKYSTAYLLLNQIFKDFFFLNYCIIYIQLLTLDDFFRSFHFIPLRNSKGKSNIPQPLPEYHQETEGSLPFSQRYLIRIILQKKTHSVSSFYSSSCTVIQKMHAS